MLFLYTLLGCFFISVAIFCIRALHQRYKMPEYEVIKADLRIPFVANDIAERIGYTVVRHDDKSREYGQEFFNDKDEAERFAKFLDSGVKRRVIRNFYRIVRIIEE